MAAQIHFTVSDPVYSETFELAKEYGMSVSQYARIVFLANRTMDEPSFREAVAADLDRREDERRQRDAARNRGFRSVRRVDGGGFA